MTAWRKASRFSGASGVLALGLIALPSRAAAIEEQAEAIGFEYTAPPGCPSREQVLHQIGAYTTKWTLARPDEAARHFVLRIVRRDRDPSYVGRFDLRDAAGVAGRDVVGESCDDVALGLAVAVALAIDPRASLDNEPTVVDEPSPPPSPLPDKTPPSRKPLLAQKRSPSHAALSIGARGEANSAVSGLLGLVDVYLELEWNPAFEPMRWLRPALRVGFRQSFTRTNRVGESVTDIGWSAGQVEACPSRFMLTSRVSVEGCLGSNLGVLTAQARGIPGAGTTRRFWFDYGALLAARWQLHSHLFAEAVGGAWFPVTRDRLRVEPDGVVTEAPRAGFSAGLGVGWRF